MNLAELDPNTGLRIAATILLGYTMVKDIATQRIGNWTWAAAAIIMAPLTIASLAMGFLAPMPWIFWGLGLSAMAILVWISGSWGGADAKGIILLAWTLPLWDAGGAAPVHILVFTIPVALLSAMAWTRLDRGPLPLYGVLSPLTMAAILLLG